MNKINKVAIYGMGKSGKAALKLAKKYKQDFYAVNKGPVQTWWEAEQLADICGTCACASEEDFAQHFHKMDEIVISPGIPTTHPALKKAVEKGVPIISEIEYAYRRTKDIPVIAITGTNGKTTTTTMIAEALKMAGKSVFCGGNIGIPYCDLAISGEKVDYAVIEVSSFQLETIKEFHPKIGLILNVFPNHSERYDAVHDYATAKFNMLKNMTGEDHLILGTENPYLDDIKDHPAKRTYFTKGNLPTEFKSMFDFSKARARGEHNEANFFAAYEVLRLLKIPNLKELFQQFINEFPGVAHRLEFVLSRDGLTLYNDAKSTNSLATTTAINAFKDSTEPLYLILGGKLRNESDKLLPDLLPFKGKIAKIFTIGDVTERLYQELGNDFEVEKAGDLKTVFEKAKGLKGNLVFSPAFPSFDQFKNYVDRGEKFKAWAKEAF
ncbi:UDP-N-acetylmuramoyl-L-alanine--D-glutamate ligase [Peredibacter starrii]|uniref:UDP-N-acetylmuramoylalanine--D-glutamate ligase n=1 Tax=Peredibacter starrii TaxID=28202 RepID=A0AAX4HT78_9BACT|nr:UDP-N-acetylmuramoyl-L-alanine--D-glutamate ligase [Peredibacter starrii]WPU66395.1 UDP-N-acetylmuramoyl-L-alanine--D-glutamate ligase [Peredibacter starrii]